MKIAHVVSNFSGAVGDDAASQPALELSIASARLGYAVTVVSLGAPSAGALAAELRDANVIVQALGGRAGSQRGALIKLAWLFARARPDVVHTHQDALAMGWAASRMLSPLRGPRLVHTVADGDALRRSSRVVQALLRTSVEGVAEAEGVAAEMEGVLGKRPQYVIPDGIRVAAFAMPDADRASARAELGLRRNQVVFLTVFDREHDSGLILDAFARPGMGPARLLIADAGALRGPLEAQARALDVLGRVDFLGDSAPLPRILGAADALVVAAASPCSVVKQAMAAGLPVIAAQNAPWVSDATGLGFSAGDAAALSAAMKRLAQDRMLGRRLGLAGATVALEQFDARAVAQRYEKVYAAACGKTR